ncbi:helix-turn-helix domain-containing protein [Chitinophaga sp. GCM10012297]|uniref:Helix-turn-helix transcriptional regulator n=1 Tax=Chitinophaga chungangae TaxID=2821488 RepID=A0ABS3YD51_9BACT|nr:helix-turn-helix domain-containing protein [Chitinophaga chungangae]MBO9152616.1 helix-turn-helix transcriptional regulator [Chitinophaga chungangae]
MKERNVGPRIRRLRESRNYTQEYVAQRLNIGATAYGNIERGDVKRITLARWMEIAEILGVHYSEIFGEWDVPGSRGQLPPLQDLTALAEYFRKDKLLLYEILKNYKEIFWKLDEMLQSSNKAIQQMMQMQLDFQQQLLELRR